ncbi:MAG TPA: hypothetical protein VG389_02600 [Myxococcota bacterium]|nr:hypothetical protein [Myxococcota bacterium]
MSRRPSALLTVALVVAAAAAPGCRCAAFHVLDAYRCDADVQCSPDRVCGATAGGERFCVVPEGCTEGAPCDDGLFCTVGDVCTGGICAGVTNSCSDANDCTADSCSEDSDTCTYANVIDGNTCFAAGGCLGNGTCQSGVCGNAVPEPPGTACDDDDACTSADACDGGGACVGTAVACDDGNSCTDDGCDPAVGCTTTPLADSSACNDGVACTAGEVCAAGVCGGGLPPDCSTLDDACHVGACVEGAGGCAATPRPDGTACDDGNVCTGGDVCALGACAGNPFTVNGSPCDDGNSCTQSDSCVLGACMGTLVDADFDGYSPLPGCGPAVDCNDGNFFVNPGVAEVDGGGGCNDFVCNDGVDNDCDGLTDCGGDPGCT